MGNLKRFFGLVALLLAGCGGGGGGGDTALHEGATSGAYDGLWSLTYTGAESGSCEMLEVRAGVMDGVCISSTSGAFAFHGTVDASGNLGFSTIGTDFEPGSLTLFHVDWNLSGRLFASGTGEGIWSRYKNKSGTWSALRR